ncbi:FimV/HubP family polar landmark protein [Actimicrobium antarcticum]|uniref:FimV/HubP family polar landmark protein n=1 Tax=Actimicrobium antarcticum TaxID=1051899 RepID=UPI0031D34F48
MTIFSSLGQPLNAEIELTSVTKDEADSLVAKLAPADAFKQANIDFNPALFNVRFGIEQRGGRQFIRVTSAQPINEPYVDMLLELGSSNGRLVREYTFLLDPVEVRNAQVAAAAAAAASANAAQVAKPVTSPAPVRVEQEPKPSIATPVQAAGRAPKDKSSGTASPASDKSYLVKSGDSLARIANQVRPAGVSLDQMLVALYRANPSAFTDDNMNRMRAGQILTIPTADAALGISASEAKGIVVAQALDFSSYRNKLAGQVAATAAARTSDAKRNAGGAITSKVEEPKSAATESKDKLKLSKASEPTASAAMTANAAQAEDNIAKDKAIAEANSRVKELEKNVNDLQKLLELKNKDLAEQQRKADSAAKAPLPAVPAATAAPVSEPKKVEPPVVVVPPVIAAVVPEAAKVVPSVPAPGSPAIKPPAPAAVPATAEPGFIDSLVNSSLLLPGLGLVLVGLGAFSIFSSRRKKKTQQFEDSILTDSNLKANSLFGSTGGQSVDTNNSVFNSNFAPSASQLNANEVDPIAEADVYIAYGRDAQAEEILKEALRTQPEHNAVRLKLLEIYASRKDLAAFELMASELYGMTKGEGREWEEAASMGIALDPNNPLYAGGKAPDVSALLATGLTAQTRPMDDLDLEGLLSMTQPTAMYEPETTPEAIGSEPELPTVKTALDTPSEPNTATGKSVMDTINSIEDDGLDFDLDGMGAQEIKAVVLAAPGEPDLPELKTDDEFSLDFDESPLATTDSGAEMVPELDIDQRDLGTPSAVGSNHAGRDVSDIALDGPPEHSSAEELTASPEATSGKKVAASTSDPLDFDLSGISLDLEPEAVARDRRSDDLSLSLEGGDTLVLDDDLSNAPEMATKLDLAIAYEEIGDKEGARELLDEVIKGGSNEQVAQARTMMDKLA